MGRRQRVWHAEDIKAELRKRHGSLSALSRKWGLAGAAISNTLGSRTNSITNERRIAQELGVALYVLWPDRWSPEGRPLPRSIGKHRSSVAKPAHRQSEKAA